MAGKLYICPTPIGNLGDITLRVLETLKAVSLIAAEDTRHTLKLLNHFEISKPMISYFEHNKAEKGVHIIERYLLPGKDVALVTDAGTPAISDPGEELVAQCAARGIQVISLPGAAACITALAASGLPTGRFAFEGFLSVNATGRRERLDALVLEPRTLVFYEAPHKLISSLRDMLEALGDRNAVVARELTKMHEEYRRDCLSGLLEHYEQNAPRGEFVLIVEGASEAQILEERRRAWKNISIVEQVARYVKEGMDEKSAIKKAAQERGLSKREVYAEVKIATVRDSFS